MFLVLERLIFMNKLYWVLYDSGIGLLRNKKAAFAKGIFTCFYFFILTILVHAWLISSRLANIEKQKVIEENNTLDTLLQTNANEHLITLLLSMKTALAVFSLGLLFFGIFYLTIHFQRILLLDKRELVIKKLLGSSARRVTSEFFTDSLLAVLPSALLGIILAEFSYLTITQSLYSWLTAAFYSTSYFILHVDLPLIGVFVCLVTCQFLYFNQKITNL